MVTSFALQDDNTTLAPALDPVLGAFRMTEKKLGICMPWDSESLRQRSKAMGICFCYLRSAYPHRRELASVTIRRWDDKSSGFEAPPFGRWLSRRAAARSSRQPR